MTTPPTPIMALLALFDGFQFMPIPSVRLTERNAMLAERTLGCHSV